MLLCLSWINKLLTGQAFDLSLADALNAARNVIDSHSDISAIKTRTCNGEQLTALSMTSILADTLYGWHDLHLVAGDIIEGARLTRALIIHGVACTAEECGHSCSRVSVICLNRTRDVGLVINLEVAIRVVQRTQVHTGAVNAKVDRQVAGELVPRGFLRVYPNRGSHAWVDYGRDQVVDNGSEVPVVEDLAVVRVVAGQLLPV